ncbi:phenylacetate--CoA ligase family protein [Robbsia andropogonis]|uniref:CoF synthetase n=1 Tax=Robbsia andropogonis TaxID=28092 RepID=UPI002A6AB9B8|nr:CoF synthetase [Robbsia andropogonis]
MSLVVTRDPAAAKRRVLSVAARLGLAGHLSGRDLNALTLEEVLAALPVCRKKELVSYGHDAIDEHLEKGLLFSETSGTTSTPLQTPRGTVDLKWNTLNQVFAYKRHLQPGVDRVAILHPGVLSPFVEASARALQELGVGYARVYPIPHVCEYDRISGVLERYRITAMMSTPTLVYKVLYELRKARGGTLPSGLKTLLLTGEHFSQASAANLGRILGPEGRALPFVYGSSEAATLMYGIADGRYRPISEDFIFEIVRDRSESVAIKDESGRWSGRLVVTWLRDGLLPILRYDTNDMFTVEREVGTGEYVFRSEGRADDYPLDIEQKEALESVIFGCDFPVFHYECLAYPNDRQLTVRVVTDKAANVDISASETAIVESLRAEWKVNLIINPVDCTFYEFSPTTKTNRYRIG